MLLQTPEYPDADQINGSEYESVVIFRNDDPAPWTNTETLEQVNQIFIEAEVPLTHGIVPHDDNANTSLTEEHELCQYLEEENQSDLFEYSIHGYHHLQETEFHGGSEFGDLPEEEQRQKIAEGKNILEDCTGEEPTTFIPPFNTYDETTTEVLNQEGFQLVSGGIDFQEEYFDERGFWQAENIIHLPSNLHLEDWEEESIRDLEVLKHEYEQNKQESHMNVVLFHYFFFEEDEQLDKLEDLITHFEEDDAYFMTLEQFAEKTQSDQLIRTQDGWTIKE